MKTLLNTPSKLSGGLMADNSLRQEKNVFITTVAIVTRSALPEEWIWNRLTNLPMYISVNVKAAEYFPH